MKFISPWIHTTNICNLKCEYCYVRGDDVMTSNVYEALKHLLLNAPAEKIHLRFAGGEPTMTFKLWEPFGRSMLNEKRTTVEVLTNLTSPQKEFFKFAELDNVSVSVSIDGGNTVKPLNKSMVEKLEQIPRPWIMTTLTNKNINELKMLATLIGMKGYGWALTTDYFEKSVPYWEILVESLLNVISILKSFSYDFNKISFNNFSAKAGFSGCHAGNEMFAVACDGNIYKCQTQIGSPNPIGDVFNGYKRTSCSPRKECQSCSITGLCKGWCPLYYKVPNPICNVIKIFANEVLKEVNNAK